MKWETSRRFKLTESLFSILIIDFFVCFSAVERRTAWDAQALVTFCLLCSCSPGLRDGSHRKTSLGKGVERSQQGQAASGLTLVPPFHPKDNHFS